MLASPPNSSNHATATRLDVATRSAIPLKGQNDNSLPLAGVVVCCTSIPDEKRTSLAAQAEQMGAIHRYDLTLDTTHLVIGKNDTEKYHYVARERTDVRPMTVAWIEAVRDLWVNDKDINMEELERAHTMPTLHSLKISMTGCDDPNERASIAGQVQSNGAMYEGDLTKQITHLISFRTEGAKYRAAKTWGIKIVSIEWLRDTLERGMILNEALYDPTLPAEERGRGAWDRTKPKSTLLGKRQREESIASIEGGKKKLRRTASMKLNSQSEQMWDDIVGAVNVAQVHRSGQWETSGDVTSLVVDKATRRSEISTENQCSGIEALLPRGIFAGHHFHHYGFNPEQAQIVQNHLLSHGARISDSIEDLLSSKRGLSSRLFIIVPHDLTLSQHRGLLPHGAMVATVTVWWLERCLHNKRYMDPEDHVIGRPFNQFPIEGFKFLSISTSGFTGIDLLHVTKSIKLLGAAYNEDMTRQTSVILVKALDQIRADKFAFAQQWKIPIVSAEWLWESIRTSSRISFKNYRARERKIQAPTDDTPAAPVGDPQTRKSSSVDLNTLPTRGSTVSKETVEPSLDIGPRASDAPKTGMKGGPESIIPEPGERETEECSLEPQALIEINSNSSFSKTASTASAPSDPQIARGEYNSEAISDLLAKTKTAIPPKETPSTRRRGGPKRILGRVTSNMSSGSTTNSRAASIDSAAHGIFSGVVDEDNNAGAANQTANERIQMLLKGAVEVEESQPPPTQLGYYDPESEIAEENARRKMMGDQAPVKLDSLKAKTLTINDIEKFANKPRSRRARTGGK